MYSPAPGTSSQLMVDPAWPYPYLHINTHYELTLSKRVFQTINNISIKIQYSISTKQSNSHMAQPYTQAQPVSYSLSIGKWVLKRVPCMPQSPTIWWLFNHEGPTLHTPHGEFHRSKPFIHNNIPLQIIIQLHAYHKHIIISLINEIIGPSPTYTITRAKPSQTL